MIPKVEVAPPDLSEFDYQMQLVKINPKKRKRLFQRVASMIRDKAKQNVKKQQNPDGSKWPERNKKRKKGNKDKMLRFLPTALKTEATDQSGEVSFKRSVKNNSHYAAGVIANMHASGHRMTRTAVQHAKAMQRYELKKGIDHNQPATKGQARWLSKNGFTRKSEAKGKEDKLVKASAKWIVENMTFGLAGSIIRAMTKKQPKDNWNIKLPKREFLGVSKEEEMKIFKRALRDIDYGWDVKNQNRKRK